LPATSDRFGVELADMFGVSCESHRPVGFVWREDCRQFFQVLAFLGGNPLLSPLLFDLLMDFAFVY